MFCYPFKQADGVLTTLYHFLVKVLEALHLLLNMMLVDRITGVFRGHHQQVLVDGLEEFLQIETSVSELVQELDELQVIFGHVDALLHTLHEPVPFLFHLGHILLDLLSELLALVRAGLEQMFGHPLNIFELGLVFLFKDTVRNR